MIFSDIAVYIFLKCRMKTLTLNQMLVETYVALLRNLSRDTKL